MKKQDKAYINKENILAIKGIALILMFAHHFFAFPNWYISGISYPYIEDFCYAFNCCVPIYAFITGYIYSKNENRGNVIYSIKKITDILIYYWFVYIVFLIINFVLGNKLSFINIIQEAFLIKMQIMCFCWYIRFYCISMLILPLLSKLKTKKITLNIIIFLIFPIIVMNILSEISKHNMQLQRVINEMLYYFPCISIGIIFGKFSIFNKIKKAFKYNIPIADIIISLGLILIIFLVRSIFPIINFKIFNYDFVINLDIIYIPIFIYYLTYLIKIIKHNHLLIILGKYSLLMWLIHCIFFNTCNSAFQPILYFPKEPLLVLIWGLFLCYIIATILKKPIEKLLKSKNKLKIFDI